MKNPPGNLPLDVYLLGLVDFEDAQRLQRRLVYDLGERPGGALVLCEHPPTISVGRQGSRMHVPVDDDTLRALNIRMHWVNRGGGCVLHLPGQLVAYFALSLDRAGQSVTSYLAGLGDALVGLLGDFDLDAMVGPDGSGVFLGQARVATIGVAVNRWIAYHGMTINVGPFLEPFDLLLDEPGPGGRTIRQTSMESRRQRATSMAKVREGLIRRLETRFGLEQTHVFTQHPLIRRKVLAHAFAPTPG